MTSRLHHNNAIDGVLLARWSVYRDSICRTVRNRLYRPSDPQAFVLTFVALALTGLAAAFLPARRAASLDPMRALRHE
ncbi:MAG: hypothetical protein ACLQVN_05765 [Bryobacteraceae bacterium]